MLNADNCFRSCQLSYLPTHVIQKKQALVVNEKLFQLALSPKTNCKISFEDEGNIKNRECLKLKVTNKCDKRQKMVYHYYFY